MVKLRFTRIRWFRLHSWGGLSFALLLIFVLFTGTIATISIDLYWLSKPALRASKTKGSGSFPWATWYYNAQDTYPDVEVTSIYTPKAPWFAAEGVAVNRGDLPLAGASKGERFRIYFHPETGVVQGIGSWYTWQVFFRKTHRHLMIPVKWGVTIVGLLSFPLLLSLISGIKIYRKWWRSFFLNPWAKPVLTALENRVSERRFWGNAHRWLGVWSLWFVLLIALTGIWYLVEQWGLGVRYPPTPSAFPAKSGDPFASREGIEKIIATTSRLYPELEIRRIRFDAGDGLIFVSGQAQAKLVRDRANQITFDGFTGEPLQNRKGEDLSLHMRISEAADPLHFGYWGGTLTRYLWFLLGIVLTTLSISGVYLFGLRTLRSNHSSSQRGSMGKSPYQGNGKASLA